MSHRLHEPPLWSFIQTGRARAEVIDVRRTFLCLIDRVHLAHSPGASPERELLPKPVSLPDGTRSPLLEIRDLQQPQGHATVLPRQASVPRPPVKANMVALLDPERSIYVRMEQLELAGCGHE